MTIIEDIENLSKEHIKKLSDKFIIMCYNEHRYRWAKKNPDKINQYQRDYYKKYLSKNHKSITKQETVKHQDIKKIDPLDIIGGRI